MRNYNRKYGDYKVKKEKAEYHDRLRTCMGEVRCQHCGKVFFTVESHSNSLDRPVFQKDIDNYLICVKEHIPGYGKYRVTTRHKPPEGYVYLCSDCVDELLDLTGM